MTDVHGSAVVHSGAADPIRASSGRGRVWVVDDSASQLQTLVSALSNDFEVEAFAEAESVLERILAASAPDLLIVDWQLPGMSGLELCQFLRGTHGPAALPILVLTVRSATEDIAAAFEAGANDYVQKPFAERELLARVKTLVQARKSQQLAQGVLEAMADGFVAVDGRHRITMANTQFGELVSAGAGEVVGRSLEELAPEVEAQLSRGGRADQVRRFETQLPRAGRWLEVDLHPSAEGGLSLFLRDITGRKEQELQGIGRAELERQLIGIVSHDLRNPISTVLMSAAMVLRMPEVVDPRVRTPIERIVSAAQRAERMIRDLLDFTQARVGAGLIVSKAPTDLHATVTQVVEEFRASRPGRNLQLQAEGDATGVWDQDRLAQLAGNLIANALDYGSAQEAVKVQTRGAGAEVTLSVQNKGSVIAPEKIEKIFEPMQRATNELSQSGRSVGLGLYIVRKVAEAHGGKVSVNSSADSGTTFHVTLPRTSA